MFSNKFPFVSISTREWHIMRTVQGILFGAAAIAAVGACPAFAADLPARTYTKAPVAPAVAVFNWTGGYIGLNAGAGWADSTVTTTNTSGTPTTIFANPANIAAVSAAGTGGLATTQLLSAVVKPATTGRSVPASWSASKETLIPSADIGT
jgi:hypothetical protein